VLNKVWSPEDDNENERELEMEEGGKPQPAQDSVMKKLES
jgi:hypothetical protein